MPSTSQEMLDYMSNYHGPDFDDQTAIAFLQEHGYTMTDKFEWKKDGVDSALEMTDDEYRHMRYLIEEWDFGGLCE